MMQWDSAAKLAYVHHPLLGSHQFERAQGAFAPSPFDEARFVKRAAPPGRYLAAAAAGLAAALGLLLWSRRASRRGDRRGALGRALSALAVTALSGAPLWAALASGWVL